MSADDWYRNEDWNQEIKDYFFLKLSRARSQRDQYIYIQAASVNKRHPKIALELAEYYFEIRTEKFHDLGVHLVKAYALLSLNKNEEAMLAYRAALKREKEYPNVQSSTYAEYPYVVAIREIKSEYKNAIKVLNENADKMVFPIEFYKWHASKALIERDGHEASKALEAAEIKKSGFLRHQKLGLVTEEHRKVIKRLIKLKT